MLNNDGNSVQADNGGRLLDVVMYLVSLVSQPSKVSMFMDPVRVLTAKKQAAQFSPQDVEVLHGVKDQLEDYLITKEEVAAFTPESLRIRTEEHFATSKGLPLRFLGILAVVVLVTGLSTLIPTPTQDAKSALIASTLNSMLSLGGTYFFLTNLGGFTSSVQRAYSRIGLGFALTASSQIAVPILLIALRPSDTAYIGTTVGLLSIAAVYFLYTGIRMYARQTGIQSRLLSAKNVGLAVVVSTVLSLALVLTVPDQPLVPKINLILQGWTIVGFVIAALLIAKIARTTTVIYSKAAHAFRHALAFTSIVIAYFYTYFVLLFYYPTPQLVPVFLTGQIIGTISCALILRAGYAFYRSTVY